MLTLPVGLKRIWPDSQRPTPAPDRPTTWINPIIAASYERLFRLGHAHSVECWQDDRLVGGLYGVSLGRAFFGESMVSRVRDASKVALAHLLARLIAAIGRASCRERVCPYV